MIGAICLKISDRCSAKIYLAGTYNDINWDTGYSSGLGEQIIVYGIKNGCHQKSAITIDKGLDDEYILRIVETKRYMLKMECMDEEPIELPRFQNEGNKFLRCDKDKDSVSFQFINYLGRSKISFGNGINTRLLQFEVVPDKMDYEDDYISLTEALAQICSDLLLEYSGSTSNVYSQSEDDPKTLLEQFIFLRQFCYGQNLRVLFESVKRNPDRILAQENEFKIAGSGRPSGKFYTNPFSYSRRWVKLTGDGTGIKTYMPQEIAVTRKYDNFDTHANRFVKFALQKFDFVCVALIEALETDSQSKQAECIEEAKVIHEIIDDIFRDSFFEEVGSLDIMPQNNQILQKREGYFQIFSAYSMLDLALQLDWKGKENIYEGESKNVALLYEYWLFFELYKIVKSIDGCEIVETNENPFLLIEDGITVSLEQGRESCQSFKIKKYGTKINLYYNRTFSSAEFHATKYEGSYSRPFRPDYTLAIFPDVFIKGGYNGEEDAIRNGAVSYIHFDAKYRISDLTVLIGKNTNYMEVDEELAEDKTSSIVNTYKRGDLLKMHTYNDAIRRTIGSYVLYPGSNDSGQQCKTSFSLYDEILPGIGAFAIKPSIDAQGENELKDFIATLVMAKEMHNSRLNRMKYYMEMVLKEPSIFKNHDNKPVDNDVLYENKGNMCVMGYIRADSSNDYYFYLKENGLLKTGAEFLFYFYAIKGKDVYSHHKEIFRATEFRFYINQIHETDTYKLEPVLCKILANELISRTELVEKLGKMGYNTDETRHHADFYFVLTVRVEDDSYSYDEYNISEINSQNGNDTFSPHSPKVIFSDMMRTG